MPPKSKSTSPTPASVAGDAVAQIYIHQRWGSASRPVRQLKGFKRVTLNPARRRRSNSRLAKMSSNSGARRPRAWAVEPSTFDVWAGEDSTASLHAELNVTE